MQVRQLHLKLQGSAQWPRNAAQAAAWPKFKEAIVRAWTCEWSQLGHGRRRIAMASSCVVRLARLHHLSSRALVLRPGLCAWMFRAQTAAVAAEGVLDQPGIVGWVASLSWWDRLVDWLHRLDW